MKKIILLPLLIGALMTSMSTLQSCDPDDCSGDEDVDKAPNLYLYPQKSTNITVNITFPLGGKIVTSIPDYGNGWVVNVSPSGLVDGQYNYLYYTSLQPSIWQMEKGWVVAKNDLKSFFTDNLASYGFAGREITDFTDYWIPRLVEHNYFLIYPQVTSIVDKVIRLDIFPRPDKVLRMHYVISETDDPKLSLPEPETPVQFIREGFVVTEWGVILK